ncbi:MAG: glutamate synthase large subunit [Kofleriaceae bacterium]
MRSLGGLHDPVTEHDGCGVGFVAHARGEKSRAIVDDALTILRRLAHRAATGADPETGDGAGILLQLPHRFFKAEAQRLGINVPSRRRYGVGQLLLPSEPAARAACERIVEEVVAQEGQVVLGWRDVPIDEAQIGPVARATLPTMRQVYVRMRRVPPTGFERRLFVIRRLIEQRVRATGVDPDGAFHVASLSTETIVYKGLLRAERLGACFADLRHPDMVSAIAVVHSRFSTNTSPTWPLVQPLRYVAHNGEINTLRGNVSWMEARRSQLQSAKFQGGLDRLQPIIVPGKSDSAQFDNMLELLVLAGRSVPHAMMMMIPEAWEGHAAMSDELRAFYRYAASLVEPWDGPAAIVFSDGLQVGATLDRNGLRPARWVRTDDDRVILASEAGVLDLPPERIVQKGRLTPGRMLLVDTTLGRIVEDDEIKREVAHRFPYGTWLARNVFELGPALPLAPSPPPALTGADLTARLRAFGYTDEDLAVVVAPMAATGKEPIGSMGTDTPLAVLSEQDPPLTHYFHQLFAQVTNPPIDPIREALVMTLETALGPDGNPFDETPEQCHQVRLPGPVLLGAELVALGTVGHGVLEPVTLPMLMPRPPVDADEGTLGAQLAAALQALCDAAVAAIDDGHNLLVLSDRGVDAGAVPIPALLALSAVQQRLVREGIRMQAGLVVETGDLHEVHDLACFVGYGAAAVVPYLALDAIAAQVERGEVPGPASDAQRRYVRALEDGLLKVMSKMGISTLQSYRGAQIFEAVGLDHALIAAYFAGTPSRLGGVGLGALAAEAVARHAVGFPVEPTIGAPALALLPDGGLYSWRRHGERHAWNPDTIAALRDAVLRDDRARFAEYERLCEADAGIPTLRALLELVPAATPIPVDEVEPTDDLVRRFVTGAMSFGSISAEAHETLAIAMNRLGGKSNSGEGGEELHRFTPDPDGSSRRSAIKQVASGRFGVTAHYLATADELQIKMAQGAKPGEGGQLPGAKVDERIAKVRWSTPGVTLISPPPHHDIYSIEDLAQLIYDLTAVNPTARVSVKLVSEVGVGTVAAGVAKARAGGIVISGFEGGTGASPLSSLRHAGLPWELGLAEAQQVLVGNGLRSRVRLQVDGGLRTSRDVIVAAALGAEEFGMATASLVATGCVMLRKCHLNTCSVGIATQDPTLRARYAGRPEHVIRFFTYIAEGVRAHLAALGRRSLDELVGDVGVLRPRADRTGKAARLDLAPLLAAPAAPPAGTPGPMTRRATEAAPWSLDDHADRVLLGDAEVQAAIAGGPAVTRALVVRNTDRAVGTLLAGEIARAHGDRGLPDGAITVRLDGSAGQSLGAFLTAGVTLEVAGEANDFVGKGLSGGRLAIRPPDAARFVAEDNVVIGNTALYGATAGELFARGQAGERFAVRNSGARAVVEGVGDHGCEYMTGGVVVVLGATGRNFAAGMSGGVAYVLDREQALRGRCNLELVELEPLDDADRFLVQTLLESHVRWTGSELAQRLLAAWDAWAPQFVKVMPIEYKRALASRRPRTVPPSAAPELA